MKINLEINNRDEALEAINFLNVYVTSISLYEVEEIVKPKKEKNKAELVEAAIEEEQETVLIEEPEEVVEAAIEEEQETVLIEEPEEVVAPKKAVITVISLTAKAKEAVTIVGKDKVIEKIKQYGERISAVDEAAYESLNDDLIALIEG
jgi:thiamine pyrophosphate-dependent acetolactate synthase large subunit-like protein